MNSLRKWLYKPKKTDKSLLAQFYFADEELNTVAAELDSFDSRKDPERCQALVTQLRACQDKVLTIIQRVMDEAIPFARTTRDFRVKFPDDVVQENLAGQLWFGAECLAAGSSIMNREVESATMRPLARALTKNLDSLRCILRDQCLISVNEYSERIREALIIFDKLFAEFELSYVSAMVPVKSVKEYETIQEITVLFSETVLRAKHLGYITTDMIDEYDPALMFTIPRLAIICGLLIYADGPLNPDSHSWNMSDMFRPFQTLLYKIRELLYTLSETELLTLERALCSQDEPAFLATSRRSSPPAVTSTSTSTTTTTAVQTDSLPLLGKETPEDAQSCSSLDRSTGSDTECISHGAAGDSVGYGARQEEAACSGGMLSESVSCGAICCHTEEGSRSEQETACRSKCLNKCDSNDSGLHSDGVSNSDSLYTISSSDSHQHLSQSALPSPVQSLFPETCLEDGATEEDESHYQLCQSVHKPSHDPTDVEDTSSLDMPLDSTLIAEDLTCTAASVLSESSIASGMSQASSSTLVSGGNQKVDICVDAEVHNVVGPVDVEDEEESFYSASPGESPIHQRCDNNNQQQPLQSPAKARLMLSSEESDLRNQQPSSPGRCQDDEGEKMAGVQCHGCPSCRTFMDNLHSAAAEARYHENWREECQGASTGCKGHLHRHDCVAEDRDSSRQRDAHRQDEEDGTESCDKREISNRVPHGDEMSERDCDDTGAVPSESQTGESNNCDSNLTSGQATLQDLCGVLQAVQTVFTGQSNTHDPPQATDTLVEESLAENSTSESSATRTGDEPAPSCDNKQQMCDTDYTNQSEGQLAMERPTSSRPGTDENVDKSVETGDKLLEEDRQSRCDRCTQTPHSAINNAQSSKIHHHHSRQHSSNPTTIPPNASQSSTASSASPQTVCDNCDNSTNSAKTSTHPPSPAKLPHSQPSSTSNDARNKVKKRHNNSPPTQSQKTSKVKNRGAKLKSPASSSMARLKQYADNWSDCSSSSEGEKGSRSRHRSSCVDGTASGSSGCEGSSSTSDCEWDQESCSSSETSSYNSECHDDEEIALAVQAAELASRNHARARFRSSSDMIHRLFVCISGVADQLQTNFAGDLRNILRVVFNLHCSEPVMMEDEKTFRRRRRPRPFYHHHHGDISQGNSSREPPTWIPDDQSTMCMSCKTPFTFVRRRHHCRNCGKIFCGRCSSNAVSLPHFGHNRPVRVCNRCFMFQVTPFTMQGQT